MPNLTWYGSPNFTPGRTDVEYVVIHWMDGYLAGADATFQNTVRQTSAHYGVEDDVIHQYVDEANTAWHAGNFDANTRSIGIEHSAMPGRTATDATYASTIWLITGICQRYGLDPAVAILPHQHFTSTDCPGTMDLPRIIAGVQAALGGASTQSGTITPIQEDDLSYSQWPQTDKVQLLEDIKNVLKPTQDRVLGAIPAGLARQAIPGVPRATDNGDIWDIRQDISKLPAAILGQNLKLNDGTVTTVASLLAAIFAKPAGGSVTGTVTATDVEAIATAVETKVAASFRAQINK